MPRLKVEVRVPRNEKEITRLAEIVYQSFAGFGQPPERTDAWLNHMGKPNLRIALLDGRIVAGLSLLYFDLYFGGRRVAATGVSAVGVSPEVRGSGVGSELMRAILREQAEREIPLSALYPATYTVYRRVGYEIAGHRIMYKLNLGTLGNHLIDHASELHVRPATAADLPAIEAVYLQRAQRTNGHPHRTSQQWRQLLHFGTDRIFAYVVERGSAAQTRARARAAGPEPRIEGYLIFTQTGQPRAPFDLNIRDMYGATPAAIRRILTFLSAHTTTAEHAFYDSGPVDVVMSTGRDEYHEVTHRVLWMLRVVDARAFLTQRGYPRGLNARLALELEDDVFPKNNGRFELNVADGEGTLRPLTARRGGGSVLRCGIRGLAPLGSGLLSAGDLRAMGLVDGDEDALAAATSIFAGHAPWMNDRF